MANIEKHTPGVFCWVELGTTDQNAAKGFYEKLFGWTADDHPMRPNAPNDLHTNDLHTNDLHTNDFYTMFKLEGRFVGAAYTLRADQRSQGVPEHWMLYVAVENADQIVARAAQVGGKVMAPAFDMFDAGRMAVLEDPTGAAFSIWQGKKHIGTTITEVPGTLCWADLSTPNQERASRFYRELFGWQMITDEKDSSGYLHIKNGDQFIGGITPADHRQPDMPPHWLPYFSVTDCDAVAGAAKKAGAKLHLEPMTMKNVGRFAVMADPQGAVFAIFQHLQRNS